MEKLVSSFSHNVKSLPADYIFPPGERPGEEVIPISKTVPVIDLEASNAKEQILNASEEVGFFQVINHGIPGGLVNEMMSVLREFFEMPEEDKAEVNSGDLITLCRLYTSTSNYEKEDVHYWRDNLRHPCHPLEECIQSWPQKASRYREVVGECSVEVRKLALRIMEMISEGLGLDAGEMCMGCRSSRMGIEPIPNAFVVNIGYQLQITSDGKLKSVVHRAVTNSSQGRTKAVFFIGALPDTIIGPAKALVNEQNPSLYKSFCI